MSHHSQFHDDGLRKLIMSSAMLHEETCIKLGPIINHFGVQVILLNIELCNQECMPYRTCGMYEGTSFLNLLNPIWLGSKVPYLPLLLES